MLKVGTEGITVDEITVSWGVLGEGGLFDNPTTRLYARLYPTTLELVVWDIWRSKILGANAISLREE